MSEVVIYLQSSFLLLKVFGPNVCAEMDFNWTWFEAQTDWTNRFNSVRLLSSFGSILKNHQTEKFDLGKKKNKNYKINRIELNITLLENLNHRGLIHHHYQNRYRYTLNFEIPHVSIFHGEELKTKAYEKSSVLSVAKRAWNFLSIPIFMLNVTRGNISARQWLAMLQ